MQTRGHDLRQENASLKAQLDQLRAMLDRERATSARADDDRVIRLIEEAKGAQAALDGMVCTINNMKAEHAQEKDELKAKYDAALKEVKDRSDRLFAETNEFKISINGEITTMQEKLHRVMEAHDDLLSEKTRLVEQLSEETMAKTVLLKEKQEYEERVHALEKSHAELLVTCQRMEKDAAALLADKDMAIAQSRDLTEKLSDETRRHGITTDKLKEALARVDSLDNTLATALCEAKRCKEELDIVEVKLTRLDTSFGEAIKKLEAENLDLHEKKTQAEQHGVLLIQQRTQLRLFQEQLKQDCEREHQAHLRQVEELEAQLYQVRNDAVKMQQSLASVALSKPVMYAFMGMEYNEIVSAFNLAVRMIVEAVSQQHIPEAIARVMNPVLTRIEKTVLGTTTREDFIIALSDLTDTFPLGLISSSQPVPASLAKYTSVVFDDNCGDFIPSAKASTESICNFITKVLQHLLCLSAALSKPPMF
jgi:hypothetical protein